MTSREANADLLAEITALRDRVASLTREVDELQGALTQASHRETATREILSVISSSPDDVQPVFDAIAESAARLCSANDAQVLRVDGEVLRLVSAFGAPAMPSVRPLTRGHAVGRAVIDRKTIHIRDLPQAIAEYSETTAAQYGVQSLLAVPLLHEGVALGAIRVSRTQVQPFTDKQITLLQTFADQAVIAIENVRLFKELEEKNHALTAAHSQVTEALEQQTASGEILRVISQSATDVQPVFDTIIRNAVQLCGARLGAFFRFDGEQLHLVANYGHSLESLAVVRRAYPRRPDRTQAAGRSILERAVTAIPDAREDPAYDHEMALAMDWRSVLAVPLLRGDGSPIGVIIIQRQEAGHFAPGHVELLKTFADQAVIAIENVRLFTELQEKNRALTQAHAQVTEALEQQTATSEILRVISSSPTDVQPVFDAVAEAAARLCQSLDAAIFRWEGDRLLAVAHHGPIPISTPTQSPIGEFALPLDRGTVPGRAVLDGRTIHVVDLQAEVDEFSVGSEVARRLGFRTSLTVPLMREGVALGCIVLRRTEAQLFTDQQVALLETFADQAVIAIENVRLFRELEASNKDLREALDTQTATSDILGVISRSPTDIQPVFDAIVRSAVRLCDGSLGTVVRVDSDRLDMVAHYNVSREGLQAYREHYPMPIGRETVAGMAILDRRVINVIDAQDDATVPPRSVAMARAAGFRGVVAVPLLRDGEPIGLINVSRRDAGLFSDQHIALLKTFADQAVIAIENVRLFKELESRNRDLTEALEQQTASSEILRVISSSPTDVTPVFDAICRSAVRLLGAHQGGVFRFDGKLVHIAALTSLNPEAEGRLRERFPQAPNPHAGSGRAIVEKRVFQIPDTEEFPFEGQRATARDFGFRRSVWVPMVREEQVIGVLSVNSREPGPYSERQIELLKTFADQAVIAVENVRLFTELQEKNRALTESLAQQTATSEILRVISLSPTDVQPVFDAIADSAVRLCESTFGVVHRFDGTNIELPIAMCNVTDEQMALYRQIFPMTASMDTSLGESALTRRTVQVEDIQAERRYTIDTEAVREARKVFGYRTMLAVPMIHRDHALGIIAIWRREQRPFSVRQIALVETFADQAVIAIENVRLFTELQTSNRELTTALDTQTATADILRVISGSRTDVQPVFDAIVTSAVRLLGGYSGVLTRVEGDQIQLAALTSINAAFVDAARATYPRPLHDTGAHARAIRDRASLNIADIEADRRLPEPGRVTARIGGYRSFVAVPLVHHGEALGAIGIGRGEAGGFTDDEIALLQTFADQAVIAIENARLLTELQARTTELTRSVDELTALGEVSRVLSSTLNLETVLQTIVTRANHLAGTAGCTIWEYDDSHEQFRLRASHYAERADAELLQAPGRVTVIPQGSGSNEPGHGATRSRPDRRYHD